jgi:hypothetical protein
MRAQKFPAAIVVLVVHLIIGILLLLGLGSASIYVTPLSLISLLVNYHPTIVGLILALTAFSASIPFIKSIPRTAFVLCIAPQQTLLVLHSAGVLLAISSGHYPDGYVPAGGGYFILIDQVGVFVVSIWHTFEYSRI